ncbi:MAG: tRNA dihydrouridine synthase DusB [Clostridia bacterium]|nr:tRNA dihydrouridine synthase DusB [Clostridia bacterium]
MLIGNINIDKTAALAPMAGVTDKAFREICAMFGAAYFTSEMISTKGIIYGSEKTFSLSERSESEYPFALQLFGNNPKDFSEAIKILGDRIPEIIDINMGCPATKIVKENSGSALMKNPELCGEIVYAAKSVSAVPVTIKIRSGWSENTINAVTVAKICEQAGAAAITVHGRTKQQGYSGNCNQNIIKSVKEAVKIPVIGNGDITSAKNAADMIDFTGCDMVAVGRGAMGNPWIFSEINALKSGTRFIHPSIGDKIDVMKLHIEKICKYKGEHRGITEARKHLSCYVKDIKNASEIRRNIFASKSKSELLKIIENIDKING